MFKRASNGGGLVILEEVLRKILIGMLTGLQGLTVIFICSVRQPLPRSLPPPAHASDKTRTPGSKTSILSPANDNDGYKNYPPPPPPLSLSLSLDALLEHDQTDSGLDP